MKSDFPARGGYTPKGRKVVTCPAQVHHEITCASCELCAVPGRKAIIAFRAHGYLRNRVDQLVQLRRRS